MEENHNRSRPMSKIEDLLKVKRAELQAELKHWSKSLPLSPSESVAIRFSLEAEVSSRISVSNTTSSIVRKRNERILRELLDVRCLTDAGISHPHAMRIHNALTSDFVRSHASWEWDGGWENTRVKAFLQKTDRQQMLRISNFGKNMLEVFNTVLSHYGYQSIL